MTKTIAEIIKEKKLVNTVKKEYPIIKYDSNNNNIYYENSNGSWTKSEYDSKGNETYYEDSDGDWTKYEGNNNLEFKDGKYYLNGQETKEAEE